MNTSRPIAVQGRFLGVAVTRLAEAQRAAGLTLACSHGQSPDQFPGQSPGGIGT
ncbi:hypothetical protein [Roseicella frigidaeris]|uniref:hypothetical protein n=1 Tax=Roseicella frigidaeris TaxID=2230885 RepID=UPI001403E168|nr:hypothetical protein [Roseicella frigidaeris]